MSERCKNDIILPNRGRARCGTEWGGEKRMCFQCRTPAAASPDVQPAIEVHAEQPGHFKTVTTTGKLFADEGTVTFIPAPAVQRVLRNVAQIAAERLDVTERSDGTLEEIATLNAAPSVQGEKCPTEGGIGREDDCDRQSERQQPSKLHNEGSNPSSPSICKMCDEPSNFDGYCLDHWPGYNLCADENCEHYRCEHGDRADWKECGNAGCPCKAFVEGSTNRVINQVEWKELRDSWKAPAPSSGQSQKCQICGVPNPVWFAANNVWNEIVPERVGFICPICFITRAEEQGFACTGWQLVPENPAPDQSEPARDEPDDLDARGELEKEWMAQSRTEGSKG